jgi:hypothetical protein
MTPDVATLYRHRFPPGTDLDDDILELPELAEILHASELSRLSFPEGSLASAALIEVVGETTRDRRRVRFDCGHRFAVSRTLEFVQQRTGEPVCGLCLSNALYAGVASLTNPSTVAFALATTATAPYWPEPGPDVQALESS